MHNPTSLFLGIVQLALAICSLFFPKMILPKNIDPENRRPYLVHQRINWFAIAAFFITIALLPEELQLWVGLAIFIPVLASALFCNRRYLGSWFPWQNQ